MLTPTIGIEVHVELKTKSKVFSPSLNSYGKSPNTNVDVIDLGYPGTLPILNKEALNLALKAAIGLNSEINKVMHFDRKNYFYPDLAKGYQITQNKTPIGYNGFVEIEINGETKKIGLERIHLEEDTCKSIHNQKGTLLDFNRAGVPLIEIVTKLDIKSAEEAVLYLEKLRETLLYLGVSDCKIEEGSMRCDANISLHKEGEPLGTKIEVKNIGSINNVGLAIQYEIIRQTELLEKGEFFKEETRRYDDKYNKTVLMRVKQTGNDYRYFPEPNIPYVILSTEEIEDTKANLPVLPTELKKKYKEYGLNEIAIKTIIQNKELCDFYEEVLLSNVDKIIAGNLLTGEVISYLNKNNKSLNDTKLNAKNFTDLLNSLEKGEISSKQTKEIIVYLIENDSALEEAITKLNIKQISNSDELQGIINNIINNNPESVADYKNGKDRAVKFFMGQIMKETKGQANPKLAMDMLIDTLNK